MRRLIPLTLLVATAAGLSACGGGGSDPASAPAPPTTSATSTDESAAETGTAAQPGRGRPARGRLRGRARRMGRDAGGRGDPPGPRHLRDREPRHDAARLRDRARGRRGRLAARSRPSSSSPARASRSSSTSRPASTSSSATSRATTTWAWRCSWRSARDAPLAAKPAAAAKPDAAAVAIEAFAFAPATINGQGRPDGHLGEPRPGRPHGHGRGRLLRLGHDGRGEPASRRPSTAPASTATSARSTRA